MTSNVEKNIYDFDKSYHEVTFSKKRPPLDYELNEAQKILYGFQQKFVRSALADGPSGDGFLVETTGSPNQIRVRSGLMYIDGYTLNLPSNFNISTLTTPISGSREDYVYLEWGFEEWDKSDDPNLADTVNVGGIETAVRQKLVINIKSREGALPLNPPFGKKNYIIAKITRVQNQSVILPSNILDTRLLSGLNYVESGGKIFVSGMNLTIEGTNGLVAGNQFNTAQFTTPYPYSGINDGVKFVFVDETENVVIANSLPNTYHTALARLESDGVSVTANIDLRRFKPFISSPDTDSNGDVLVFTAGENIAKYDTLIMAGINRVIKSNATTETTMPIIGMALDAANTNGQLRVLVSGYIQNPLWSFNASTVSDRVLYGSLTSGGITPTPPTTLGNIVQKIGVILSPTSIYFNPDLTFDIVGGVAQHEQNTDLGTDSSSFILRYGATTPMTTPAGFYVQKSTGIQPGVRFNGVYWEYSNDGSAWQKLGGTHARESFIGDGVETVFTLTTPVGDYGDILVFGGVILKPLVDYVLSPPYTIQFLSPPLVGENIECVIGLGGGDDVLVSSHEHTFDSFTANGIDQSFVLTEVPQELSLIVTRNGMVLTKDVHYTLVSGNIINITPAPSLNDIITVFYSYV